jgi:CelD/BcsL family acetyltransferase involved in cellulose biosynthesis
VRVCGVALVLYLAVLAAAGLGAGISAARGPGGTMSSELVVDGARVSESTHGPRGLAREADPRRKRTRSDGPLHVARTAEEVEALRVPWEALQGDHLTSDIDYFLTVLAHAPGVIRPHVLLVEAAGLPAGLVVARLEDVRLGARLGYGRGVEPRVRSLTVSYGGLLGRCAGDPDVLETLRRSLAGERIDVIQARMLGCDSPLHARARSHVFRLRHFAGAAPRWRVRIPDSFERFLGARSKETRRHIRRYARRLEDRYGAEAEIRFLDRRDELETLLADSARVHRTTYQHALGVGFSDRPLERRLTELALDRGWFRSGVLYLRGDPVAFWHGNAYRGTFGTTVTGFDPAFSEDRPGTYLLMKIVERLCADPAVERLDFGSGDAEYKRRFADECITERDLVLFEPRPRALALNAVETAVLGTAALGRAVLLRGGRLGSVRTAWRRRRLTRAGGA